VQELNGKVAVVTGAASGIGRAMADRFAAVGMKVVLADIEAEPLDAAAREVQAAGHAAIAVRTDVSDAASVEALAQRTLDEFGAVHIVCNNAGVGAAAQPAWEMPFGAWEWMINVNLYGVIHGVRAFVPLLVAQDEGHVVNTTSIAGLVAGVGSAPYTATKHAVVGLSEALRRELEVTGSAVKVSLLVPGRVNTRIADALRNWPAAYGRAPAVRQSDRLGVMPIPPELERMLEEPMDPADVAALVLDAVRTERFWVITHPNEVSELVRNRLDELLKAEGARP
jgi:NAD(P)-dependent dehydrogenase (short-subunit alcohol dehydrogenase family)